MRPDARAGRQWRKPHGGDRQGHPDLQLHVRGRARGRAGSRRRGRAADGADADAGGGAPDPFDAVPMAASSFQRLAQPAPRQRHQVLLGARARSSTTPPNWPSRPRWMQAVPHRRRRSGWAGRCAPATPSAATSRPARIRCRGASTCAACASLSIARMAPPTSSAPLVLRELGARLDAIGIDPNGLNINDGVGSTHPAIARRAGPRDRCRSRHRLRRRRRPRAVRRQRRATCATATTCCTCWPADWQARRGACAARWSAR